MSYILRTILIYPFCAMHSTFYGISWRRGGQQRDKSVLFPSESGYNPDQKGTEGVVGLGVSFEPGTLNRVHVTDGTSYDCATTRPA